MRLRSGMVSHPSIGCYLTISICARFRGGYDRLHTFAGISVDAFVRAQNWLVSQTGINWLTDCSRDPRCGRFNNMAGQCQACYQVFEECI